MTRYEQETMVNYNRGDKTADIYTADPVVMRRLDKLVADFPDIYKVKEEDRMDGQVVSKTYVCPKRYVEFKRPIILSEERKEELRARIKEMHKARLLKQQEREAQ